MAVVAFMRGFIIIKQVCLGIIYTMKEAIKAESAYCTMHDENIDFTLISRPCRLHTISVLSKLKFRLSEPHLSELTN